MGTILCSYNCKFQKDGYCYLNDISAPKNTKSDTCIYFQQDADAEPFNSSDDLEPL